MHNEQDVSSFDGLSRALRQLRIERRLTQAQLAERAGIGRATIQAYETGRRNPSVARLDRLLEAMGVGLADLLPYLETSSDMTVHRRGRFRGERRRRCSRRPLRRSGGVSGFCSFLESLATLLEERR